MYSKTLCALSVYTSHTDDSESSFNRPRLLGIFFSSFSADFHCTYIIAFEIIMRPQITFLFYSNNNYKGFFCVWFFLVHMGIRDIVDFFYFYFFVCVVEFDLSATQLFQHFSSPKNLFYHHIYLLFELFSVVY